MLRIGLLVNAPKQVLSHCRNLHVDARTTHCPHGASRANVLERSHAASRSPSPPAMPMRAESAPWTGLRSRHLASVAVEFRPTDVLRGPHAARNIRPFRSRGVPTLPEMGHDVFPALSWLGSGSGPFGWSLRSHEGSRGREGDNCWQSGKKSAEGQRWTIRPKVYYR